MNHLTVLLAMGGYAQYVWPAYIAMIVVFAVNLWIPLKKNYELKAKLRSKR